MFWEFCSPPILLLYIPPKIKNKMKKFLSPACSLKSKNIILFFNRGLVYIFFQMVIFTRLFQRCPILWKSMLKTTTLFWRCLTLFKSTLKWTTLIQSCSTLFQRCWINWDCSFRAGFLIRLTELSVVLSDEICYNFLVDFNVWRENLFQKYFDRISL